MSTPHRTSKLLTGSLSLAALTALITACGGGGGGGGPRPPANLTYDTTAPVYDLCGAITPNTPTNVGGAVDTYSISPALPAGLALDPDTGVISGSPSAISASATYTITAANSAGQTTVDITLEVAHVLPSGLSYPDLAQELGRGVYIELAPRLNAGYGDNWTVSAGALPAGLSMDPATGVISGVPSAIETTNFSVTVEDCATATTFQAFTADVVPPYTRGACAIDASGELLRTFVRNSSSGALQHHGKQWCENASGALVVHPYNRLVFAAAGGVIRSFTLDTRTLEMRSSGLSTTIGAATINDLACTNDGRFLYALTALGVVHSFAIDTGTGALSATPTPTAATGSAPTQIVISPGDEWLFVASAGADAIDGFSIDALDGDLTALGATASGDGVRALALTSDGARLYAACSNASDLHGYDVDALTGALTPLGWSPAAIGILGATSLALLPDDSALYVGLDASDTLRTLALDALTGAPSPPAFADVDANSPTQQLLVEPRSAHVYSLHDGGDVQIWEIGVGGELSASSVGVSRVGADATELALVFGHGEWTPTTRSVYVTSLATDGVWEYGFANGALSAIGGTPLATGINPQTISVHPFADYALVAHQSPGSQSALSLHRIDFAGELGGGDNFGSSTGNVGFDFDRSGAFGYLVRTSGSGAVLTSYGFDSSNGSFDALGSSSFSATAWPPAVHPAGTLLVVPDSGADQLDVFELDPQTGVASYSASYSTGGVDPFRVVFDSTGRFVFAAHIGSDQLSAFAVDLSDASLTPVAGSPFASSVTPLVMAIATGGSALMVADTLDGEWAYFTIDHDPTNVTADGALTLAGTGTQSGMALLRFDASDSHILWVHSGLNRIRSRPITAPGTLGADASDLAVGAQITSMGLRNR